MEFESTNMIEIWQPNVHYGVIFDMVVLLCIL